MLLKLVQAFEPVNELLLQLLSEFDGELVRTEAEGASSEWKKHLTKMSQTKKQNFLIFWFALPEKKSFLLRIAAGLTDVTITLCWRNPVQVIIDREKWVKTPCSDFVQKSRN